MGAQLLHRCNFFTLSFILFFIVQVNSYAQTGSTFKQWGDETLSKIEQDFRIPGSPLYYENTDHSAISFHWPAGIQLHALIAAGKTSQAETFSNEIHAKYWCYYNNLWAYNSSANGCGDRYYDDNAWVAKANMELYKVTNNVTYLNRARDIIAFSMSGENKNGESPGGGIKFHEGDKDGMCLCATAPTMVTNLMIYQATGIQQYLTDALRLYNWVKANRWDYGPGYRGYENAVITQAAILLNKITGDNTYYQDARHIGLAMETAYVDWNTHALRETGQWGGHDMTNAYVELYQLDGDIYWLNIASGYLKFLHDNCKDANGRYPESWTDAGVAGNPALMYQAPAARAFAKLGTTIGGYTKYPDPVAIFKDCDYSGWWQAGFMIGKYTFDDLRFHGAFGNDISSVKVQPGYKVTFYEGKNFDGASIVKTADQSCLTNDGWNDKINSMIVEVVSPTATVYKDCGYAGTAVHLPIGNYTLAQLQARGINDNDVSSLTISLGYSVEIFESDNFTGTSVKLTGDTWCLVQTGNNWNDKASSIKVTVACPETPIVPNISVNGATAQQINTVTVLESNSVKLSPQPLTSGSWSWTGPNGFTSMLREVSFNNIALNQAGVYNVIYTNTSGCKNSASFILTVKPRPSNFMAGDNVAVFNPINLDSAATLPSLIFKNNLINSGPIPSTWSVIPTFSIENGKNVARISYTGNVDFYGNGEVTGPLRRNNTEVTLWNTDSPNYGIDNGKLLYQSHPWLMGVRSDGTAFGIIADNTWKQSFLVSNTITITSEGPGFRVVVIERNSPQELLKTLADLTGKMDLPALWTLGNQQSRFSYTPASKVQSIADEFRNRKIPCDVIWMDIDYMDQYKVFTFNPSAFNDPKGLNDYLHSKNFKSVFMIDPGVKKESGYFVYDQGTSGNHWVKKSDGTDFTGQVWPGVVSFPDFTRPDTRTWWSSLYKDFMAKGTDGVWNDMNEPSVFDTPNRTMPEDNWHRGGGGLPAGSHLRYHNVFGYLMVKATREGIKAANPDKRPFVLSRSNFLGGQQYAATWTGDNESSWSHLKLSIPMSITLGLSGQPVSGPDIGGFTGNCTGDLLAHWMAIGAYYPFCRNHTIAGSVAQEPWAFGTEVENVYRTSVNRRYRLLPYMYSLFREASETGMPIMRPVLFADNTDLTLRGEQQAFLLGKDLLIVPKWSVNPSLPKGDWEKLKLESTEDRYQASIFVRAGAVVPIGNIVQSTSDYKSDSITLFINPLESGVATGSLYYDDGDGYTYKSNDYAIHEFNVSKQNNDSLKVVINQIGGGKSVSRVYRIGYVTDKDIVYFPWSPSQVRYIPLIKDNNTNIDLNGLNSIYISGSFNAGYIPMKNIDDKKWKADSLQLQAGTTYTFKFYQSNKGIGTIWGNASGLSGNAKVVTDQTLNISFSVATAGYYSISFDQTTLKYVVQKTPTVNSLSIVGDATDPKSWNSIGLAMQQSSDDLNVFTWTGHLNSSDGNTEGTFKFHYGSKGYCDDVWLYASVKDQALSASSLVIANGCSVADNKWKVQTGESGTYKITINVATKTISIKKLLSTLAIVGDATSIGWDSKGLAMEQAPDRMNIFTWTGMLTTSNGTTEGKFKFHSGTNGFCDDTWLYGSVADQSLSATSLVLASGCSVPDNKWKVQNGESGIYKITVDTDARTIKIEKVINTLSIVGDATSIGWDSKGLPMQQSADNANVFTWTGTLTASNGTTEGKFKFHSGLNGFCDDLWLYGSVADQSLSSTSLVIANGCSVPDNKWKVQNNESGNYTITVDLGAKTIKIQRVLSTLSIVGDATSIGWDAKGLAMQQSSDDVNVFTWTGTISASNGTTEGKFKFHSGTNGFCDDTWLYATVADQPLSAATFTMAKGCSVIDNKWKVQAGESGTYTITINVAAKTIKIQKVILSSLSIVGDATSIGWNTAGLPMQQSSVNSNIFTWTGTLTASNGTTEGKFKFHSGTNGWCDDTWLYATAADQSLTATSLVVATGCSVPDNKWKVQPGETGTYKITVDVFAKTIKIEKILLSTLAIVGDATSIGWDTKGLPMVQSSDNPNLFTWTGTLSATDGTTEGKFKFHSGTNGFCDDTWLYGSVADQSLSSTSLVMANGCTVPDNKWKVQIGESGSYEILVDVLNKTIKIQNMVVPRMVLGNTIESSTSISIDVYPNPASDYTSIRLNGSTTTPSEVSLYDLSGNKLIMISDQENSEEIKLPMFQLNQGMYILKVKTEEGVFIKMIVK